MALNTLSSGMVTLSMDATSVQPSTLECHSLPLALKRIASTPLVSSPSSTNSALLSSLQKSLKGVSYTPSVLNWLDQPAAT